MATEYINHIKHTTIDGRDCLIAEPGYIMTDGKELYSRHLILAEKAPKPTLSTITEEEYEAMLAEQETEAERYV